MRIVLALALWVVVCGCASEPETAYDTNPMYSGTGAVPIHPSHSRDTRFFNKSCSSSGHNDHSGSEYSCSYSE